MNNSPEEQMDGWRHWSMLLKINKLVENIAGEGNSLEQSFEHSLLIAD